jgi:hypothetical protein
VYGQQKIEAKQEFKRLGSYNFEIDTTVTTPFPGFETSQIKTKMLLTETGKIDNEVRFHKWVAKSELEWLVQSSTRNWRASNKMVATRDGQSVFSYVVKYNGEIKGLERHPKSSSYPTAKGQLFSVQWGKDPSRLSSKEKVELSFNAKQLSWLEIEADIHLKTLADTYNLDGELYLENNKRIHLSATRDSDTKRIVATFRMPQNSREFVSALIETPFSSWKKTSASCAVDNDLEKENKIDVVCAFKRNSRSELDVSTRFEILRTPREVNGLQVTVEVQMPGASIEEFMTELTLRGLRFRRGIDPRANILFKWGSKAEPERRKMEFDAHWRNFFTLYDEITVQLSAHNGFASEKWTAKYSHDLRSRKNSFIEASASLSPSEKITFTGRVNHLNDGRTSLKMEVTTPFRILKSLSISGELTRKQANYGLTTEAIYNNGQAKIEINGQYRDQPKGNDPELPRGISWHKDVTINIKSPFNNWEDKEILIMGLYSSSAVISKIQSRNLDVKEWEIYMKHDFPKINGTTRHEGFIKIYFPYSLHTISKIKYEYENSERDFVVKKQWTANNRIVSDLSLEIADGGKMFDFYADNMWRGVQAKYLFTLNSEKINGEGTVCWNLREAETSQVQIKLSRTRYQQNSSQRQGLRYARKVIRREDDSFILATPFKTIGFKTTGSFLVDPAKKTYKNSKSFEIIWDLINDGKVGFELAKEMKDRMTEAGVKLWHPLDKHELVFSFGNEGLATKAAVMVKYSMKHHPNHEMGLAIVFEDKYISRHSRSEQQVTLTAKHPALTHDVSLTTGLVTETGAIPTLKLKTHLSYSADQNKKLRMEVIVRQFMANRTFFGMIYAHHAPSQLNTQISGSVSVPAFLNTKLSLEVRHNSVIKGIDIDLKEGILDFKTTTHHVSLKVKCTHDSCELLDQSGDGNRKVAEIFFHPQEIDLHVYSTPGDEGEYYRIRGRWRDTAIGVEAYNSDNGKRDYDVALKAKLNQPKHLKFTGHLKPGLLKGIIESIATLPVSDLGLTQMFAETAVVSANRFLDFGCQFGNDVVKPVVRDAQVGMGEVKTMVDRLRWQIWRAIQRDDFYLGSIVRYTKNSRLGEAANELKESVLSYSRWFAYTIKESTNDFLRSCTLYKRDIEVVGSDFMRHLKDALPFEPSMNLQVWNYLYEAGDVATQRLYSAKRKIDSAVDMGADGAIEFLENMVRQYQNHPWVVKITQKFELLSDHLEDFVEAIEALIDDAIEKFLEQVPWLEDNALVATARDYWRLIKDKVVVVMDYWGMRTTVKSYAVAAYKEGKKEFLRRAGTLVKNYSFSHRVKYHPEQGKVAVDVWVPVPLKSLKQLPDGDSFNEIKDIGAQVYTLKQKIANKKWLKELEGWSKAKSLNKVTVDM